MRHLHPRGPRLRSFCRGSAVATVLAPTVLAATVLAVTVLVLLLLPLPAAAQDGAGEAPPEMTPEQQAAMEAWMEAMTPGEPHLRLADHVGEYTMTVKSWTDPEGEPQVSQATSRFEMILGGRFLQETVDGVVMGQPFHGRGLSGYDNVRGRYWSTWVDSMSTGTIVATGEYDEEAGGLVMHSEYADPLTGEMKKVRTLTRHLEDGRILFQWFEPVDGGGEAKTMEILYVPASG